MIKQLILLFISIILICYNSFSFNSSPEEYEDTIIDAYLVRVYYLSDNRRVLSESDYLLDSNHLNLFYQNPNAIDSDKFKNNRFFEYSFYNLYTLKVYNDSIKEVEFDINKSKKIINCIPDYLDQSLVNKNYVFYTLKVKLKASMIYIDEDKVNHSHLKPFYIHTGRVYLLEYLFMREVSSIDKIEGYGTLFKRISNKKKIFKLLYD